MNIAEEKLQEQDIDNVRIARKMFVIRKRIDLLESNFLRTRNQRAIGVIIAIGALAGLGIANLGLHADLRNNVNTLHQSMSKLDVLEDAIEDIQESINDPMDKVECVGSEISNVKDIFMLLDQLHVKTIELNNEMEYLIQDLVLANTGSVTSTLLLIIKLIQSIEAAKSEWIFLPFVDKSSVTMYYPLLSSYHNGSSVIIDVPFSSELTYHVYKFIPFPMQLNGTILEINTKFVDPLNYALSVEH